MNFRTKLKVTFPFAIAAGAWALVGLVALSRENLPTFFALWALCLFDLVALAKTVQGLLGFSTSAPENRLVYAIQAFSWLIIKLACLGIFALVLIKGKLPSHGLLFGLATLVVVPLIGGLIWSQRTLSAEVVGNGA